MNIISEEQLFNELLDPMHHATVRRWLDRGDGVAVYQNQAPDSVGFGHRQFVSFGSPRAQLEMDSPPQRMPDIGHSANWAYQLEGVCQRSDGDAE